MWQSGNRHNNMDWLNAVTAALAIVGVPLALRYPLQAWRSEQVPGQQDEATCDCPSQPQPPLQEQQQAQSQFPQKEETPSERHPRPRR